MRPRISITGFVRPSVRRSDGRLVRDAFVKNKENLWISINGANHTRTDKGAITRSIPCWVVEEWCNPKQDLFNVERCIISH